MRVVLVLVLVFAVSWALGACEQSAFSGQAARKEDGGGKTKTAPRAAPDAGDEGGEADDADEERHDTDRGDEGDLPPLYEADEDDDGGATSGGADETSGEASAPGADDDGAAAGAPGGDEDEACDLTNDLVKLKFTGEAGECFAAKRVWNFYTKTCSPVAQPTTFACDWASLEAKVKAMEADVGEVQKSRADKAKLMACGEGVLGGKKMVLWLSFALTDVTLDATTCKVKALRKIWTGCAREFDTPAQRSAWSARDPVERVKECLQ